VARWLIARGIEAHVIHSASVAVSRERSFIGQCNPPDRPASTHRLECATARSIATVPSHPAPASSTAGGFRSALDDFGSVASALLQHLFDQFNRSVKLFIRHGLQRIAVLDLVLAGN
jgi:hypothetical protein